MVCPLISSVQGVRRRRRRGGRWGKNKPTLDTRAHVRLQGDQLALLLVNGLWNVTREELLGPWTPPTLLIHLLCSPVTYHSPHSSPTFHGHTPSLVTSHSNCSLLTISPSPQGVLPLSSPPSPSPLVFFVGRLSPYFFSFRGITGIRWTQLWCVAPHTMCIAVMRHAV